MRIYRDKQVLVFLVTTILLILINSSKAQTLISNSGDWSAFFDGKGKNKICYVASVPKKETGKYKSRGSTYILVTHRPAQKKRDIFELRAGYVYKKGSEVLLQIDGQELKLFTARGTAWARDEFEPKILKMMISGRNLQVTGISNKGTKTKDIYSLIGFTSAYKAISRVCNIK